MDSEFTDALLRAAHDAELSHLEWRIDGRLMRLGHGARVAFAVARVALERAAEAVERVAATYVTSLKTASEDERPQFQLVLNVLDGVVDDILTLIPADEVEGLLPVEGTT